MSFGLRKDPVLDEDLEDPLWYWKINRFKYPNLIKLVKKYLCIPATCTESERTFSNLNNLPTKKNVRRDRECPVVSQR